MYEKNLIKELNQSDINEKIYVISILDAYGGFFNALIWQIQHLPKESTKIVVFKGRTFIGNLAYGMW